MSNASHPSCFDANDGAVPSSPSRRVLRPTYAARSLSGCVKLAIPGAVAAACFLASSNASAQTVSSSPPPAPAATPVVDVTSLRLLLDKKVISQAEYESAIAEVSSSVGRKAAQESRSLAAGKYSATFYGFIESDAIYDSTQSFIDNPGSAQVAHPGSYAASHPRTQFSVRWTRLGVLFRVPEYHSVRVSSVVETDFAGDWASLSTTGASGAPTEGQFFNSPALRLRHAFMKAETPIVDLTFGLTWHILGWQPVYFTTYQPAGEIWGRAPQVRISKTFQSHDLTLDLALGAMRPAARDSAYPEGEAGVHLAFNRWTGVQTIVGNATVTSPASIALTGDVRDLSVANYPTGGTLAAPDLKSTREINKVGGAVAADAFVPIVAGSNEHRGNALAILGEALYGRGTGDMFTGLTSGLGVPSLVPVPKGSPAGTLSTTPYNPQIDPGMVTVNGAGVVTLIDWRTVRGSIQYYLPAVDGRLILVGNYANVASPNAPSLVTTTVATATAKATSNAATIRNTLNAFDIDLLGDVTPVFRLGLDYGFSSDTYADHQSARNHRLELTAFYTF